MPTPPPHDPLDGPPATSESPVKRWWRRLKPLVMVVVGLLAVRIVISLVGSVDWAAVGTAFGRLTWWMVLILIVDLLARQVLNAIPLAVYVPTLRLGRSLQSDLSANLVATGAPPPADVVLRVAMFRSWRIDPVVGMTGVTLNTLTFYSVRFLAPVLGLALVAFQGVERRQWLVAAASGLVALVVLGGLALLVRGDHLAAWVGRSAGRIVRRVRSSTDPEAWAQAMVRIRGTSAETLRRGLARSLGALVVMVLADAVLVLLTLRFLGVGASALSAVDILSAFLFAYPLTLLPLFGFGVLDAVLLGAWVTIAGTHHEANIMAALVIWRSVTILGPLAMGLGVLMRWRRTETEPDPTTNETAPRDQ